MPGVAKGLEAKTRIAELLDIKINCVERLRRKTGLVRELVLDHGQGRPAE